VVNNKRKRESVIHTKFAIFVLLFFYFTFNIFPLCVLFFVGHNFLHFWRVFCRFVSDDNISVNIHEESSLLNVLFFYAIGRFVCTF